MLTEALLHVVLVHPQIPQNTGNIARLTAGAGCRLHLVEPLGFSLEDRYLKRAGLDYWPKVDWRVHRSWEELLRDLSPPSERMWFFSAGAERSYLDISFQAGDYVVFGREADGLPQDIRTAHVDQLVGIPLDRSKVRSLNLANAVAVAVYEGIRQLRST